MRAGLAIAVAGLVLTGCGLQPKLLKHYSSFENVEAQGQDIAFSVFVTKSKGTENSPLLLSLTDKGQAELIRAVAKAMPTGSKPSDLVAALSDASSPDQACSWSSKSGRTKQLTFSVLGNLRRPADRIDKLEIYLLIDPTGGADRATFTSWDHFEPVYLPYTIGSAELERSRKSTLAATNTDQAAAALNAGFESGSALKESATYAIRRLSIGGALEPHRARMVLEGGPNVNLFGSSSATISFDLKTDKHNHPVYSLKLNEKGKTLAPTDIGIARCYDYYADSDRSLKAVAEGFAWVRQVRSGDSSVSEGDDAIQIEKVPLPQTQPFDLVPVEEVRVARYGLVQCAAGKTLTTDCDRLHIARVDAGTADAIEPLLLKTSEAAAELRSWLVLQSKHGVLGAMSGRRIGIADPSASTSSPSPALGGVSGAQAARLRVARIGGNF